MPRARGKTTWIKLYCYGRLHGSITYQLTEAEQSVWDKLLCLAGLCGLQGQIADSDERAYPREFIAHELHTTLELLDSTIQKCVKEGRLQENAKLGLYITNWVAYQGEYDRRKEYRKKEEHHETE